MSRHTWMDRTIEAARECDVQMPWSRRPAEVAPQAAPAAEIKVAAQRLKA